MILTADVLESLLAKIPTLRIAVIGDLFLDRYLDIDGSLTEPSIETGLDAYQVVGVRPSPGAAGTVINNLVALGVGRVLPVAVIGDDGEGYELRQCLARVPAIDASGVITCADRRTPTYTKPMLTPAGGSARELNRLDIKNRDGLPPSVESILVGAVRGALAGADGVVILDQVSLPETGVVTTTVRETLASVAAGRPGLPLLADSRERIGLFRGVSLKPNAREAVWATGIADTEEAAGALAKTANRPVFLTRAEAGIVVAQPDGRTSVVPTRPAEGEIDPVGAGDSTSAGIICALAAGLPPEVAAAVGNLVAGITVKQIGTTGTASPAQLRAALAGR